MINELRAIGEKERRQRFSLQLKFFVLSSLLFRTRECWAAAGESWVFECARCARKILCFRCGKIIPTAGRERRQYFNSIKSIANGLFASLTDCCYRSSHGTWYLLPATTCRYNVQMLFSYLFSNLHLYCVSNVSWGIPSQYQIRRDIFPLSHHCCRRRHGSSIGGERISTKTKRSKMRSRKVSLQSTKVNNKILFVLRRSPRREITLFHPLLTSSLSVDCCSNVHSGSIFQLWLSILFPHKYIIRVSSNAVGNGRIRRTEVCLRGALPFDESKTKFIAFTNQCEREKFCPSKPKNIWI